MPRGGRSRRCVNQMRRALAIVKLCFAATPFDPAGITSRELIKAASRALPQIACPDPGGGGWPQTSPSPAAAREMDGVPSTRADS